MEYLVNYFNSPLSGWLFKKYYAGGGLGDTGFRYKKAFFINLPIPPYNVEDYYEAFKFNSEEMTYIKSSFN